jgi:NSS family neurotransmitter:Na+ symporter
MRVGRWWSFVIGVVVPIEAVVLMIWWLWSAARDNPDWLKVFDSFSVGTVIVQWAIGLTALILYNRWRMRRREEAR